MLFEILDNQDIPIGKVRDFLSKSDLEVLRRVSKEVKENKEKTFESDEFFRYTYYQHPELVEIHKKMEGIAKIVFNRDLKISYSFLSLYSEGGFCPAHYDRPACKYSLDLVINKKTNKEWPIFVKNKPYNLESCEAVFFSGTDHFHYRDRELEHGEAVDLIFFHFVDIDFEVNESRN